ncbi:MAG: preprotein translocase subunit YajC [Bacteroidaceae bacterium]|nr:preprotein translocase subunit YajC [Bacteroidaceae bacterium]
MILLQAAGQPSSMPMILMMVAIFAIMWFFMIRPQQKKQKEIQKWSNCLNVGTNVVTAGGIYGVVRGINEADNILEVEVANGVRIRVDRNSVYAQAQSQNN